MSGPVKDCLTDHGWLPWELRDKEAFPSLEDHLYKLQSRQLPHNLATRARRERAVVRSIQMLLRKRPDILIRRPDKPKGFYLGNAADFERKAIKCMIDTAPYQKLFKRRAIDQDQHKMMLPKFYTLELAHLCFISKVHKVRLRKEAQ